MLIKNKGEIFITMNRNKKKENYLNPLDKKFNLSIFLFKRNINLITLVFCVA